MSRDTPGSQVVLVRNPDYWNQTGLAHLDKIVFRIEPDSRPRKRTCAPERWQVGLNLGLVALASLDAAVRAHTAPFHRRPRARLRGRGAHVQPVRDGRRAVR